MKTKFKFLWPWFRFNSKTLVLGKWWGVGFPTTLEILHMRNKEYTDWYFGIQILGFGFCIERYPWIELKK